MYKFARMDTGLVVEVDFETMMQQDMAGFITLPDGVRARRINEFNVDHHKRDQGNANRTPPPSDALGFTVNQLAEFEADRVKHGFNGIEFKPDPTCPEFMQVHFSSHKVRDDYIAHRGMVDKNKTKGAALSADMLSRAMENAKTRY